MEQSSKDSPFKDINGSFVDAEMAEALHAALVAYMTGVETLCRAQGFGPLGALEHRAGQTVSQTRFPLPVSAHGRIAAAQPDHPHQVFIRDQTRLETLLDGALRRRTATEGAFGRRHAVVFDFHLLMIGHPVAAAGQDPGDGLWKARLTLHTGATERVCETRSVMARLLSRRLASTFSVTVG